MVEATCPHLLEAALGDSDRLLAVADAEGRIVAWTPAAVQIAGLLREEAMGKDLALFVRVERTATAETTSVARRASLLTREGGSVPVLLSPVGEGGVRGSLVALEPFSARTDHDLEIETTGERFGVIRRANPSRGPDGQSVIGQRCYAVRAVGRGRCNDCPAAADSGTWPAVRVRAQPGASSSYQIITAHRTGSEGVVAVTHRSVPEADLRTIAEARLEELARRASLSPRERQVLAHVLLGRSISDIAKALGVTPRTAKFHQQNLLAKLGANSRLDLIRLVL